MLKTALPVGGGARVEDVLLGREQRQAVGIKVDRSRAHDGKSFQTTPAASLSSLVPTVSAVGVSAGEKPQRSSEGGGRSRPSKQQRRRSGSCNVGGA